MPGLVSRVSEPHLCIVLGGKVCGNCCRSYCTSGTARICSLRRPPRKAGVTVCVYVFCFYVQGEHTGTGVKNLSVLNATGYN